MKYLFSDDIGTTAVNVGFFTDNLDEICIEVAEYTLLTPQNKIVEMNPETYWSSMVSCIERIIRNHSIEGKDIACITCTTQGETITPVDRSGNALHHSIVWLDTRAESEAAFIQEKISQELFYQSTGCPDISSIWPLAKILWFKNNRRDIYDQTYKMLLLEDYMIMRLTGQFVTNISISSSTGYFDIKRGDIWEEILDQCGIDSAKIPKAVCCGSVIGSLSPEAARSLGLTTKTLVAAGGMDQAVSAIGSGNTKEGVVTETTGTAQVIAATCEKPNLDQWSPVTVYAHVLPEKYLLLNISQTAGIILKWFRDEFCKDIIAEYGKAAFKAIDDMAANAPPLSNGLMLFPHLTGMQIPKIDSRTRGVFFGVGLDTGRDCFARAIMEGVGYMLRENIEALYELGVSQPEAVHSLGGGAKSELWNQIKADICSMNIITMKNEESALLGAAMIGAVACGLFKDISEASDRIKEKGQVVPNMQNVKAYETSYQKYQELYDHFKDLF